MLSAAQRSLNAYYLRLTIERKYVPDTLNDTQFPTINEVLRLICEFNKILTTGDESENVTPGEFRQGAVVLKHADHKPPPWAEVRNHMTELAGNIIRMWNGDPAKLHAYVLWRLNWVHPFFDGNGRTSREFSYFLLCVKFGKLLPGTITITSQIQQNKEAHYLALREADSELEDKAIRLVEAYGVEVVTRGEFLVAPAGGKIAVEQFVNHPLEFASDRFGEAPSAFFEGTARIVERANRRGTPNRQGPRPDQPRT